MSQFDHEAVQGTDLSGDEEQQDELQDQEAEVEGAVKVGDTVDDVVAPGEASESSTSEE